MRAKSTETKACALSRSITAEDRRYADDDESVEDVLVGGGEHVLDLPDALAIARHDGDARLTRDVRARLPEVHKREDNCDLDWPYAV